jgi:hypothetical protein
MYSTATVSVPTWQGREEPGNGISEPKRIVVLHVFGSVEFGAVSAVTFKVSLQLLGVPLAV